MLTVCPSLNHRNLNLSLSRKHNLNLNPHPSLSINHSLRTSPSLSTRSKPLTVLSLPSGRGVSLSLIIEDNR